MILHEDFWVKIAMLSQMLHRIYHNTVNRDQKLQSVFTKKEQQQEFSVSMGIRPPHHIAKCGRKHWLTQVPICSYLLLFSLIKLILASQRRNYNSQASLQLPEGRWLHSGLQDMNGSQVIRMEGTRMVEDTLRNRVCSHRPLPLPTGRKVDMTVSRLGSCAEDKIPESEAVKLEKLALLTTSPSRAAILASIFRSDRNSSLRCLSHCCVAFLSPQLTPHPNLIPKTLFFPIVELPKNLASEPSFGLF